MEGTNSLFLLFFGWWYGFLPYRLVSAYKAFNLETVDLFSVKIIFPTLFAPWKRDQISTEGMSLQQKFQVFIMNLVSRFVGLIVKIFVLIAFLAIEIVGFGIFLLLFLIWLGFPLLIIYLLFSGLTNLLS